jgi:uncharacterized RDD family membrane protein YckC
MRLAEQSTARRGKRGLRAAAFVVDMLIITATATPFWWLAQRRGIADAVVSGVISGVLFALFYNFVYAETLGYRIVKHERCYG